ncbi:MAG: hypothetical protein WC260_01405 [Candidatus Pacearchaeota archaeon]
MSFFEMFIMVLVVFIVGLFIIRTLWSLLPLLIVLTLVVLVAWGLYKAPSVYNGIVNWSKNTVKGTIEFIETKHNETTEDDIINLINSTKERFPKK